MMLRPISIACLVAASFIVCTSSADGQSLWSGGSNAWLTAGNWTPNGVPGVQNNAASLNATVAEFGVTTSIGATGVGINMNTANGNFALGSIVLSATTGTSPFIVGNSSTSVSGAGTLTLNGASVTIGGTPTSNVILANTGSLNMTITNNAAGGNQSMGLRLGNTTNVIHANTGRTITLVSIITQRNTGSRLIIQGGGTVAQTSTAAQTFSGGVSIQGSGTVYSIAVATGLGTLPGSVIPDYLAIGDGATFAYTGTGSFVLGTNRGMRIGPATGSGSATIRIDNAASEIDYAGVISNNTNTPTRLIKTGLGTLRLSASNTHAGGVTVSAGTLDISTFTALGAFPANPTANHVIVDNATLLYSGGGTTLNSNRGVTLGPASGTSTATLAVANNVVFGINAGLVRQGTGTASLVVGRSGNAGTLELNGAGNYTGVSPTVVGTTTVAFGTLRVNNTTGSATGEGAVTVNSGATLGGTGSIAGTTTLSAGSILRPGDASGAGVLTLNNDLTFQGNSQLTVRVSTAGNLSATPGDGLSSGGTITAPTNHNTVNVASGILTLSGTMVLNVDVSGANMSLYNTYSYLIMDSGTDLSAFNSSSITYNFIGVTSAENISLTTTAGGEVYLNFTPVPEPLTILGLGAAGLAVTGTLRRRRRTTAAALAA
jgi:fibronectin-binding autotransporter adhesin